MPAKRSKSTDGQVVIAPDGIEVHTFALRGSAFTGIAEGRIPSGTYSIHRHLTLEQYTYVLSGTLTVVVGDSHGSDSLPVPLETGDLLYSQPGESLEFVNRTAETARVLFICTPPYPPDDSDTQVLNTHIPQTRGELRAAMRRLADVRVQFDRQIDERLAEIQARLATNSRKPAAPTDPT